MIGVTKYFKSSLIQNTFLFVNKGVNAFVPIILIPLCNNFFGVEQYGNLIFAQATLGLIVFADYSFQFRHRDISANAHDLKS
jgi:O-antigen/teichoic acid export membrane protein